MDLIILGNGFDLANNYKTSYNEFVNSMHFKNIIDNNCLAESIRNVCNIQKWVDVEKEIANYSNFLYSNYQGKIPIEINERFKLEFYEIKNALNNFIIDTECCLHISNPKIEELVERWKSRLLFENKKAFVISFNYLKREYLFFEKDINSQNLFINNHMCCIHGTVSSFENKIVLGVDETNIKCKEHTFLVKSFDKNTNVRGYFDYIDHYDRIIIFGTSLGDTDYRYYKPLFHDVQNKKYEIYCYGENEYLKIRKQINKFVGVNSDLFFVMNDVKFYDSASENFSLIMD